MFKFIFIFVNFSFFILLPFVAADDGGLSDIPFTGTVDDVKDAFKTKVAVELVERGQVPLPSAKTLAIVGASGAGTAGLGGALASPVLPAVGAAAPGIVNVETAGIAGRTGGTNTYSSVYHAGK